MAVDLSRSIRHLLAGAMDRASQYQGSQRFLEAADAWDEAARLAGQFAESAQTPDEKRRRLQNVADFKSNAQRQRQQRPVQTGSVGTNGSAVERPAGEIVTGNEEFTEHRQAAKALIHRSTVSWSDIAGLHETKRSIQMAYALSLAQAPAGVQLSPVRNILFYGPPGCGKSLLAAATSRGLEATFFNVIGSNLVSKYFGESSKLVSALYGEAREQSPSVIFLDEFDALTGNRESNDSGAERRILANLLAELDGVSRKSDRRFVLTIAATNTPWSIDPAILSRFERKVFIPLPDLDARRQILDLHLVQRGYDVAVPLDQLAERTAGFSGRELEAFAKVLIDRIIHSANPDLTAVASRGRAALEAYRLQVRPIESSDVAEVLASTKPETPASLLAMYVEFAQAKN
ncbi:MAG: ATP-binding protein [Planctomycetaceae bacterium]